MQTFREISVISVLAVAFVFGCAANCSDSAEQSSRDNRATEDGNNSPDDGTDGDDEPDDGDGQNTDGSDGDNDGGDGDNNDGSDGEGATLTSSCSDTEPPALTKEDIAPDHTFNQPLYVTQAPGDDEAYFVVEKRGRIVVVVDGEVRETPFLDLRDQTELSHNERGFLGLAFHPNYTENRRFFLYYTPDERPTKNVVAEFSRSEDQKYRAEPEEVNRLVEVVDPEGNHNGGMLEFGPDGYLYVGMGDGGGAGDDHGEIGNGQNTETLLGSILRLDVDAQDNDYIPENNPFVGEEGSDEIWAYGLRNPWRFSFDRETGDLYIGDVGQNKVEEISAQRAEADGGLNYGWRAWEADRVYDSDLKGMVSEHQEPIYSLPHGAEELPVRSACSVTGGYVYRGSSIPDLQGYYLYGDFCSPDVAAFQVCEGELQNHTRLPGINSGDGGELVSFGESNRGELLLVHIQSGQVYRIASENS